MSVLAKHFYRTTFLKSDSWQETRLEAMARDDAHCSICGLRNLSNDVHHVWYQQKCWDTETDDVVTLCRPCHVLAHELIAATKDRKWKSFMEFKRIRDALQAWAPAVHKMHMKEKNGARKSKLEIKHKEEKDYREKFPSCHCCKTKKQPLIAMVMPHKIDESLERFWCPFCWDKIKDCGRIKWDAWRKLLKEVGREKLKFDISKEIATPTDS